MLPLYLLTSAKTQPMLVELKSGETLSGHLINCDSWMNLTLKDVIQTSANGESFLKLPECYVRGNHIKYLKLPDEIMDYAKEQNIQNMEQRNQRNQKRRGNYGNSNNAQYNQNRRNYNNQSRHNTQQGGFRGPSGQNQGQGNRRNNERF